MTKKATSQASVKQICHMKFDLYQVQYQIQVATFLVKIILEDISQMIIFLDI